MGGMNEIPINERYPSPQRAIMLLSARLIDDPAAVEWCHFLWGVMDGNSAYNLEATASPLDAEAIYRAGLAAKKALR